VLGQGGQLLRARYQRSLVALEAAANSKRRQATAADQAATLAETTYVREKVAQADRRGREEMARLQKQQQEQRAAERRLQQQQQQQQNPDGGMEMGNLGAPASSSQVNSEDTVRGELM
jgi:hypothetical protein